ncbi:molybdopterin molybdenumtransferase [Alkalihalobacillus alcalophilus ATCC 27647 = CGMCC 1.3604]|uniref:Molybdopterin molybdenumtransferase n=1 Tax=Alkalihalobacillus alcalophilus ATCC 27647 = CGMCC 1.3604 TaxID=1218173 RepID=A0A094XFM9_ALKAL|nr:gephyrin-like molybdotransferase Glp [Alkalihalobacillus alcalophilus]KGA97600.1 molybdopterin molybdenumtransferase [Alkalihalobacillus alcalophilus ATCC 27647 = CGMCC 1.3604]MED1561386.1 molybdopterin molybdotransferase MoeA [Alkalihalobacillus alcalophilus]THG92184.1 molybdopterin molybdenumtransferase [Alkalihalobacillus alcalophilus ATCC 27647 = CGMCC 1.3604]
MVDIRKPILVSEAVSAVLNHAKAGETEFISIDDCEERYLASDLIADHDVPPFDRSPLDGFAIRAVDSQGVTEESPKSFKVIEEIGAGAVAAKIPTQNEAIRIMTGAQIPAGTDVIVMFELVREFEKEGEAYFELTQSFQSGDNISFQGEDAQKGASLVQKGVRITPGIKALLATFGYAEVEVFKKPKVGIIATGTELLDVDEELQPGKIRNSNAYMVAAQIKKVGAEPVYFGQLVDDLEESFQKISLELEKVDYLITTGGVSVGDYDFLPEIYKRLGANVLFNKIAMRPGSVTTVAEVNGKLLFGLSGNPSACFVGFELLVRPAILTSFSVGKPHLQKLQATLVVDNDKSNNFSRFIRSYMYFDNGKFYVKPTGLDKSGVVSSLADANCLMMLPGGANGFQKGDVVDVLLLTGEGSEWPWTTV